MPLSYRSNPNTGKSSGYVGAQCGTEIALATVELAPLILPNALLTKGYAMLDLVIMPLGSYKALIERCPPSCPEYELLKNGFIIRNEEGEQEVRVACDSATGLLNFAAKHCPEIAPSMKTTSTTPDAVLRPSTGQPGVQSDLRRFVA